MANNVPFAGRLRQHWCLPSKVARGSSTQDLQSKYVKEKTQPVVGLHSVPATRADVCLAGSLWVAAPSLSALNLSKHHNSKFSQPENTHGAASINLAELKPIEAQKLRH